VAPGTRGEVGELSVELVADEGFAGSDVVIAVSVGVAGSDKSDRGVVGVISVAEADPVVVDGVARGEEGDRSLVAQ
jgi:hypothetical protein